LPDGTGFGRLYGEHIANQNQRRDAEPRGAPMFAEIDFQIAAQDHQAGLLAEASARRLARTNERRPDEPLPIMRRLRALLRRLAGAPAFA
jgi:hypothetical protein